MKKHVLLAILLLGYCQAVTLYFPHVGHASSAIIQTRTQTIIIDTGDRQQGPQLLQLLRKNKIKKIDAIFISHPHDNHYGGTTDILTAYTVGQVYISPQSSVEKAYQDILVLAKKKTIPITILDHGAAVSLNELTLQAFRRTDKNISLNEGSLVLAVYENERPLLLTCADIGPATQEKLLPHFHTQRFPVITAPHHGAEKPSPSWLKLAKHAAVILQVGPSTYKYPTKEFLAATKELRVYRTDKLGNITIDYTPGATHVYTEK